MQFAPSTTSIVPTLIEVEIEVEDDELLDELLDELDAQVTLAGTKLVILTTSLP